MPSHAHIHNRHFIYCWAIKLRKVRTNSFAIAALPVTRHRVLSAQTIKRRENGWKGKFGVGESCRSDYRLVKFTGLPLAPYWWWTTLAWRGTFQQHTSFLLFAEEQKKSLLPFFPPPPPIPVTSRMCILPVFVVIRQEFIFSCIIKRFSGHQ